MHEAGHGSGGEPVGGEEVEAAENQENQKNRTQFHGSKTYSAQKRPLSLLEHPTILCILRADLARFRDASRMLQPCFVRSVAEAGSVCGICSRARSWRLRSVPQR